MKKLAAVALAVAVVPTLAFAQEGNFDNVFRAADTLMGLISKTIPIIIGAAMVLFLFGILRFAFSSEEGKRQEGRGFMLWGIIALAVMLSVWGLVRFLQNTFGLENSATNPPAAPQIPVYRR